VGTPQAAAGFAATPQHLPETLLAQGKARCGCPETGGELGGDVGETGKPMQDMGVAALRHLSGGGVRIPILSARRVCQSSQVRCR
jgi:hypothetical protein